MLMVTIVSAKAIADSGSIAPFSEWRIVMIVADKVMSKKLVDLI